jgi:hypothetical protein
VTPRRRGRLLLVLATALLVLVLLLHRGVLGAERPVCRYPLEMYRPSLHKCVLKSSYRAAGGERREVHRGERREVHRGERREVHRRGRTARQRHRRPPADDVPVQIERTEPPRIQSDPPLDGVWPAPPTAFEMRFYGVGP